MKRGIESPVLRLLWALPALLLAACGGGGGGGGGGGMPQPNLPPAITSPGTASAAGEQHRHDLHRRPPPIPTATRSPSRSRAAPTAPFSRSPPAGALSFAQTPDFEVPADADANNVYRWSRSRSATASTSATLNLAVTVTNAGPDAFRVAPGRHRLQPAALSDRVPGRLGPGVRGRAKRADPHPQSRRPARSRRRRSSTSPAQISTDGERGLLGFAPAPDFTATGTFYVFLTDAGRRRSRSAATARSRATATRPIRPAATSSSPSIIRSATTMAAGSNSGRTACSTSAVGDGGGGGDPDNNAQNTQRAARQDAADRSCAPTPSRPIRCATIAIPAGNPFAGGAAGGPKSGPMACAIRSATASIRSPRICGSATSARARARRST